MTALCQQSLGIFCWKIFGVVTNKLKDFVIAIYLSSNWHYSGLCWYCHQQTEGY